MIHSFFSARKEKHFYFLEKGFSLLSFVKVINFSEVFLHLSLILLRLMLLNTINTSVFLSTSYLSSYWLLLGFHEASVGVAAGGLI